MGPLKVMKNGSCSATSLSGRATSPLCHPVEFPWAFGPPKRMKNSSRSATTLPGSAISPPCHPVERTRISYFAALATTTDAVSRKGNRMKMIKATALDRKSGGAQWRDLRFSGSFVEMFFDRGSPSTKAEGFASGRRRTNPFPGLEPGVRGLQTGPTTAFAVVNRMSFFDPAVKRP